MTTSSLKPPANTSKANKIIWHILGKRRKVVKVRGLTPIRDQKAFLCELANKDKLVIKYATQNEWENQKTASLVGIPAPKVLGNFFEIYEKRERKKKKVSYGGWYGQAYIEFTEGEGEKTLADFLQEQPNSSERKFSGATALLVTIHNSLDNFKKKKKSHLPVLSRKVLNEQLRERIDKRLLPLFEKLKKQEKYKKEVKRWIRAVKMFNREEAISLLCAEKNTKVLLRWDYKPDNILLKKEGGKISLLSIDWGVLMEGCPWLDIGFLLSDQNGKERDRYLEEYLKLQKNKNTQIGEISLEDARKRMTVAFTLIQLIHASTNAKLILNGKTRLHNYRQVSYHLNKLVEEISETD